MAIAHGEVAGAVQDIVAAFEKGIKLVQRIQTAETGDKDAGALQDLYRSLSLGPVIVQSFFETDSKQFGASYLIGDFQTQNELKDILLQLKNLVGDLQDVLLDDREVDFRDLQTLSDACRSGAGVSLGQLSQRLNHARDYPDQYMLASPSLSHNTGPSSVFSPVLHRSTSHSTHSSDAGRSSLPRTPDPMMSRKQGFIDGTEQFLTRYHAANFDQKTSEPWQHRLTDEHYPESDRQSIRRPSSHTLPTDDVLFPGTTSQSLDNAAARSHDSRASNNSHKIQQPTVSPMHMQSIENPSRARSAYEHQSNVVGEQSRNSGFNHDAILSAGLEAVRIDVHGNQNTDVIPDTPPLRFPHRNSPFAKSGPNGPPPQRPVPPIPTNIDRQMTSGMPDSPYQMPSEMYGQRVPVPPRSQSRPSVKAANATTTQPTRPRPMPMRRSPKLSPQLEHDLSSLSALQMSVTNSQNLPQPVYTPREDSLPVRQNITNVQTQGSSVALPLSIPPPVNLPLNLPTDKQLGPFCRGAFRLFTGLQKKPGFKPARRPVGMTGYEQYWRCDDCQFSGPYRETPGPPDKKGRPGKLQPVFDPTIRKCGPLSTAIVGPDGLGEGADGIRYRWSFLAKCHVPLKDVPDSNRFGTVGGYGCLFCCAEGQARGWPGPSSGPSDAASIRSNKSKASISAAGLGATPVFGNLQLFMDHLQMHRQPEYWPGPEMLGRAKCVVGIVADIGDDWDINLLPL